MDLVKAWGSAALVGFVGYLVWGLLAFYVLPVDFVVSSFGQVVVLRVPTYLLPALVGAVAAVVQRLPDARFAVLYVIGVMAVPVVNAVILGVRSVGTPSPAAAIAEIVLGVVCAVAGWQVVDLLRRRRRRPSYRGTYGYSGV